MTVQAPRKPHPILAICSVLTLAAGLIAACVGFASGPAGGMFADLGRDLGLLGLGIGATISFACNLLYWVLGGRARWMTALLLILALPVIAFAALSASTIWEYWQERRGNAQVAVLSQAIQQDDVQALSAALQRCNAACQARMSRSGLLLLAATHGGHQVVDALIAQGATVTTGLGEPSTDLHTCEGLYLPSLSALSLAVARRDDAMIQRLLPVSEPVAQRQAMWIAAKLDRIGQMHLLARHGVSLDQRGMILDENDSLLVAAAGGAATTVGRWLIETQAMPVDVIAHGPDPYPGTAPAVAAFRFLRATHSPRATAFLQLLREHGADLDAPQRNGISLLEEAVNARDRQAAVMLIEAGADSRRLAPRHQTRLNALLADTTPARQKRPAPDCLE